MKELISYFLDIRNKGININEAGKILFPLCLKKIKLNKLFLIIGIFQDNEDYKVWKQESLKKLAEGKREKYKSDSNLGIEFFKIIIKQI